jgi:hypothetical protein
MDFSHINWLAAVVAGLSAFLVGGLWYSKIMFGNAWLTASNLTRERVATGNPAKIFGFTALFSIIMALNLAMYLSGPATDVKWGAEAGLLTGVWTFCAIGTMALFELKGWAYIFINGGYSMVSLTLMGAIIGLWR